MADIDIAGSVVPDGTQPDPGERHTGYYWIDVNGEPTEIARWDADTHVWHLIGQVEAVLDDEVTLMSDLIVRKEPRSPVIGGDQAPDFSARVGSPRLSPRKPQDRKTGP